jgi:hypothetical protein
MGACTIGKSIPSRSNRRRSGHIDPLPLPCLALPCLAVPFPSGSRDMVTLTVAADYSGVHPTAMRLLFGGRY